VNGSVEENRILIGFILRQIDGRINEVQLRWDWLAWLGLIAVGMVIGITMGVVLEAKFR
jgi:hypothetical protein